MAFLTAAVRDYRYAKLEKMMDAEDLEGVIVFGEAYFQFFTNFRTDVRTWERPIALLIPRRGDRVALMNRISAPHVEDALKRGRVWMDQVHYYLEFPAPGSDPHGCKTPTELLVELIDATGLSQASLGVDALPEFMGEVIDRLPGLSAKQVPAFRDLRRVKHPEEIELMAKLCKLTHRLQDLYGENIRPGRVVRELDHCIAAKAHEAAGERFPGEDFTVRVCTYSGPESACPSGPAGDAGARISKGDGMVNYIIPSLNGVQVEDERTWFCGTPGDAQRRAYGAALAANLAGIDQLVAGNPVCAFDRAARETLIARGYAEYVLHRTGHAMGIDNHEYPDDTGFNERPLLENEVYSCEPGIYVPKLGGFRIDDTVVVGTDGPRVLTITPKDIESVIVR